MEPSKSNLTTEDEYFIRLEQDLLRKMRRREEEESERAAMGEVIGIEDEEILRRLQDLGYDKDTIILLHLVPLVQVAWSDGSVSKKERELILQAAHKRGAKPGGPAYKRLENWLERNPGPEFFDKALRVIGSVLNAMSPEEADKSRENLVDFSTRIAQASGRFLGLGDGISDSERAALEKLARQITSGHESAAKKLLKDL